MRRGDDINWEQLYPGSIIRIHFINSLHQAYMNHDCLGLSLEPYDFFQKCINKDSQESSKAVGSKTIKLSLLYYISCKYGGFQVHYHGKLYSVPNLSIDMIDYYLQSGTLTQHFCFLEGNLSWQNFGILIHSI